MTDHRRGRRHSRYDDDRHYDDRHYDDRHYDDRHYDDRRYDDRYPDDRYYDDGYYSDSDDYYEPRPRPRHRSVSRRALDRLNSAMTSLGLADKSKSKTHDSHHHRDHHDRHRDHSRDRSTDRSRDRPHDYYPPSSSRSHRRHHSASPPRRSRRDRSTTGRSDNHNHSRSRVERGMQAAVDAAAVEAFRLRHQPGPWLGAKGGRVATAAIGAGVIGAVNEKRREEKGGRGKVGPLSSALGGLVLNRLVNGPRNEV